MSKAIHIRAHGLLFHCIGLLGFALTILQTRLTFAAVGPTSTLYLTNFGEFASGTETGLDLVQGVSANSFPTGFTTDICIGVSVDVRTFGYTTGDKGARFGLAGSPLAGGPYTNGFAASQFHDGTSDGVYNYTVDWPTGQVLRYDLNWASPSTLFTLTPNTAGWITMNPTDGSFWLSQYGGSDLVEHRSAGGTLLSSFNSGVFGSQGLALDPIDGTLWMSTPNFTLYQFSQAGTLLQSPTYSLTGQWYGMEFALPEPGAITLVAIGMTLLIRRR